MYSLETTTRAIGNDKPWEEKIPFEIFSPDLPAVLQPLCDQFPVFKQHLIVTVPFPMRSCLLTVLCHMIAGERVSHDVWTPTQACGFQYS